MFWKRKTSEQNEEPSVKEKIGSPLKERSLHTRAEDLAAALGEFERASLAAEAFGEDKGLVSAQKKVAAAETVVLDGRLGYALVRQLLHHTEHWHAWIEREDFRKWMYFDAEDIEAEEVDTASERRRSHEIKTRFTFSGQRYECVLRDEGYSSAPGEPTRFGEAEFWWDGSLVLKVGIIDEVDEFSQWRAFDVRAFKAGPWMKDLLAMSAQIEIRTAEENNRWLDDKTKEAARNIEL